MSQIEGGSNPSCAKYIIHSKQILKLPWQQPIPFRGEGDKETYTTKDFYGLIIQPIYDLILPHTSAFNLMQHFFCKCFHQCKKNCLCFKNFNDVNINNFFICWFCKFLVYLALIMLLAPEFFSLCSLLYLKLSYSFIVFLQIYRLSRLI